MAETIRTPVFSRYDVREKIGSGSMGAVYKARDVRLDRWVALKVLPPGLREHPESLERFKREARMLARLKHPGVASVFDADAESDFPFLVMEFVEGDNLEQVLRARGPLSVDEVIRVGVEVAEALEHVHAHHIIHRDVKAANIILGPEGRAVVTDFGIAFTASLPRLSRGTLGTPEYMSPEQADGRPMDGRSDLYSVGVVLFECLTGRVPFVRTDESLTGLTALLRRILEEPPPPIRELRDDVPPWLAEVVRRCLAKDPNERFTRAADLAAALQPPRAVAGPPSRDEAPGAPEPPPEAAPPSLLLSHAEAVEAVGFGPDGRRLATACKDRAIRIWDVKTGRPVHLLKGPSALSVSFRPGGVFLASGCVDGAIRIWEVETEQLLRTIQAHTGYVLSVAYSREGDVLASGAMDGAVHVWHAKTGRLLRTLGQHTGYVLSVSFSPDGSKLASGSADGAVRIWEVKTGRLLHRLEGHAGYIPSVSFSPDGSKLASGGVDGAVRVWEVKTGRLHHKLTGHSDWVMSVAFSPDGAKLASAARDQTVRLWDTRRGRLLTRLKGHTGAVMSVAFSPDGTRLASGSADHTARLWRLGGRAFRKHRRLRRMAAAMLVGLLVWGGLSVDHVPLDKINLAGLFPRSEPVEAGEAAPEPLPRRAEDRAERRSPGVSSRPPVASSKPRALPAEERRIVTEPAFEETEPPAPLEQPPPPAPDRRLYGHDPIALSEGGYTMVVAIEPSRRRAQEIAARFHEKKLRVGVLGVLFKGRLSYRVVVGQFDTRAEASSARRSLVRDETLPFDTWVMRIRPDRAF
jgi:serine/threonine protein kinase